MPSEEMTDRLGVQAETVTDDSPASEVPYRLPMPTEAQQPQVAEALAFFRECHGSASGGTVCPATDTRRADPETGRWFEGDPLRSCQGIMGAAKDHAEFLESLALSAVASATQRGADVYVCPYPMRAGGRKAGAATLRLHAHADIDGPTDLDRVRGLGAFAVASGSATGDRPHAHVYVRLTRSVSAIEHRILCEALGQRVGGHYADAGKINDNDVLRVPGTLNYKTTPPGPVSWLVHPDDAHTWEPEQLARELGVKLDAEAEPGWNESPPVSEPAPQQTPDADDVQQVARRVERLIQSVRDAEPGNGNNRLNWAAGIAGALHARYGGETVPEDETRRALVEAYTARETGPGKAERKRREGHATVASGWRHGRANPAEVLDRDREPVAASPHTAAPGVAAASDDRADTAAVKVIDAEPPALDVVSADQVTMRRVRYLWHGRIPLGAVTVAPGEEGIGKSTVLGALVVSELTSGELPGEFYGQPQDVVIVAPEDGLADVLVPRLCAAGADLRRVHIVRSVTVDGKTVPVELPRDLKVIHGQVSKVSAGLVLIDSLVTTFAAEVNTTKYKDTASVLRRLGEWAEEAGVAVLAPWHLNKREGTNTAARMMDSRAFRTAVRSVLLMVEDPEAPPGVTGGILALDKANAGTLNVPGLRYVIESAQVEVSDDEAEGGTAVTEVGRARWTGEVDGTTARDTARSALEPAVKREGPTAVQWLTAYLAEHGETARAEVLKAAEAGPGQYSASAIKNAARALAVVSREVKGYKDGMPYRARFWRLKDDGSASASATEGQDDNRKDQR